MRFTQMKPWNIKTTPKKQSDELLRKNTFNKPYHCRAADVAAMRKEGLTLQQIADELGIALATVKSYEVRGRKTGLK